VSVEEAMSKKKERARQEQNRELMPAHLEDVGYQKRKSRPVFIPKHQGTITGERNGKRTFSGEKQRGLDIRSAGRMYAEVKKKTTSHRGQKPKLKGGEVETGGCCPDETNGTILPCPSRGKENWQRSKAERN